MGSRSSEGGRLPGQTRLGADHEAPAEALGGSPPESVPDEDDEDAEERDSQHVALKVAELKRLLHPQPIGD